MRGRGYDDGAESRYHSIVEGGRGRARESSAPRSSFPYVVYYESSILNSIIMQLREDDGRTAAEVISGLDKSC